MSSIDHPEQATPATKTQLKRGENQCVICGRFLPKGERYVSKPRIEDYKWKTLKVCADHRLLLWHADPGFMNDVVLPTVFFIVFFGSMFCLVALLRWIFSVL